MVISDGITAPVQPTQQASETQEAKPASNHEQMMQTKNVAVMEAQLKVSSETDSQSMLLLYKTAIESINKELDAAMGPNATQQAFDSELDVSPEATAERIVQGATAFYGAFKEQNPELSDEESLTQFMEVIGRGIDKGFEDAREILGGLNVLEGDIATNIDKTYEHVQAGLLRFVEQLSQAVSPEEELESNSKIEK